jgi:phosphate transport system substrate-binding protein
MEMRERSSGLHGLVAVVIAALFVAGCTGTGGTATPAPTATPPTPSLPGTADAAGYPPSGIAGRLSVTGSTTVLPIAQALAERYMDLNPGADLEISAGGSSVGITSAGEGTAEIGMASRGLKEAERSRFPSLREIAIARDGIVVIVHPSNTVSSLTIEQIRGIYAGTTANWQQAGGPDRPVVPTGRDSASGTREFFDETVMGTQPTVKTMLEKNSNGAIQVSVAMNPNAIGYVGLGYIDPSVRPVDLSVNGTGVAPTIANIVGGAYPLARDLSFVTNGEAGGLAQDFIAFTLSDEGQAIVEQEGFAPVTGA